MDSVQQLREKARHCWRLAQLSTDDSAIEVLTEMEREFEAAAEAAATPSRVLGDEGEPTSEQ